MSQAELNFPAETVWIGSDHAFDLNEAYLCFRSPAGWRLTEVPQQAELFITADSRYKLWVNGRFVARGPARGYPHAQAVDRLDITAYLEAGPNLLAVQVYQPGYSHFAYVHRAAAGLLAHLVGDDQTLLVTDTAWRARRDPSFAAVVPRVSIYGSGVEERDLNLADTWSEPDYDDSAWSPARLAAPVGGYPWTGMQLRTIPLLGEREASPRLVETRQGSYPTAQREVAHLALRAGWFSAAPQSILANGERWFSPVLAPGEAAYWLYDLGRGYTCQGRFEVRQAGGQEQVAISYTEKMQNGDLYLSDPQTYCRMRMTDRFQLRAGDQMGDPFAMRGGRFLLFQLVGPTGPGFSIRFHTTVAEYPLEVTRKLPSADPTLAGVITLCEETLRACLFDGFVDNPWRESAQWIGDVLSDGPIMAAMSDDSRPLRRILELAAQGAYPDGVLPSVVPSEAHPYTVVDFNFQWVELLKFYRDWSGDENFIEQMWPTLVKLLDRFWQDRHPAGLLISQPGRRLFLDWSPMSKNEPNAAYNLHFLLALQQAVALARERRSAAEAEQWQTRAAALRQASRAAFWRQGRWYDDLEQTTSSQLTTALALLAGATEPAEEAGLLESLAARSLDQDDDHHPDQMVLASPYMHHRVFDALRQGGRSGEVIEIIRRRWGRWVKAGYPTTWENWNVDFPDGSQCHGFSAHPRYHLAEIARELGGSL